MPELPRLRRWLEARWYASRPLLALLPFAWLFGAVVRLRRAAYGAGLLRSGHPGVPVVIVGNIAVGGTGKTPLVIWLARRLREAGLRPGIVSRGYGGRVRAARLVESGDDAGDVGDEPLLLARLAGCPVATGARRMQAAGLLAARGCDVLLADDGLQHLALRRNLEIAVVDAARGCGNGALLPAGPLREPAGQLRRIDCVVLHGAGAPLLPPGIDAPLRMTLQATAVRALRGLRQIAPEALRGETVHAVAGIGNPGRFFAQLRALGAQTVEHAFPDHHRFGPQDLQFGDDRRIVMTEKDAVKCETFATDRMWCLPVEAVLPEADAARLLQKVMAVTSGGGRERA